MRLTKIAASLEGDYGKGKYCPDGEKGKCLGLGEMEEIIANSRDPEELKRIWLGWHQVSPPYRKNYQRFVELSNKGAREMGFKDTGAMWREKYDMEPDAFAAEMERLWQQVKPLYDSLYTYTRRKLSEKYGKEVVPPDRTDSRASARQHVGPAVEQHLSAARTGKRWRSRLRSNRRLSRRATPMRSRWSATAKGFLLRWVLNRCPALSGSARSSPSRRIMKWSAMPAPGTSTYEKDVRLKMCIQINEEDFTVVHHELGHNYYQMAYAGQPFLYRDSANDGFHEAIGDTIALSVTPPYLKQIGLIDKVPDPERGHRLPFAARAGEGGVPAVWLSGRSVALESLLRRSWSGRLQQGVVGVAREVPGRGAAGCRARNRTLTPGAKYHVPANTPYARYFLAAILQFQFHLIERHRCGVDDAGVFGCRLDDFFGHQGARIEAHRALLDELKAAHVMRSGAPGPAPMK